MEVSSQQNNYQMMNTYQTQNSNKPENSIQPIPNPSEPKVSNKDVYEASNGNLVKGKDGGVELTPEGQNSVSNAQEANTVEQDAAAQAQKDAQRGTATDYLSNQSKKSQVEIYLAVASDNKVEFGDNDTASIIESLRDVQKQNNAVEAYATYAENQKGGESVLY